eukprot:TRINITY_DN28_c0_g1_i1.p1 TRINITY_DN28_c0_g1~~TRINITY_DN28_c0_g1_i1.p1  ORF type:complete len:214 (+),score=50.13 TRINITY_DN28_c0_g1_i1:51-644(+)
MASFELVRPRPPIMDPKAVINAWNDWPAIKRFTYALTGGAMVGGIGGAIACFHYDIPVTTRADTYWSVFRKTAKILLRSSIAGAAAAGSFQAVKDLTDDKVGRQTAWGTIAGGFTGGFLFMATHGALKSGLVAGTLMAIGATYFEHFNGIVGNESQLKEKDMEGWDINNKFRVLLHEENKEKREALRQKEFDALKQL